MEQVAVLLDARGNVLEMSRSALALLEVDAGEVAGKPLWETPLGQASLDGKQALSAAVERAARGARARCEARLRRRAGLLVVELSLTPVRDDAGNVSSLCVEARELTEQRAHERALAERDQDLRGLLDRVEALERSRARLLAHVSQELRGPAALLLGPAERLIEGAQLEEHERRGAAELVLQNARLLLKRVGDLVDTARLESKREGLELSSVDVAELVRVVCAPFAAVAAEREIAYAIDAEGVCRAAIDPRKLERALLHLLGLTFATTPRGGRVRCALARAGEELVLRVEGSGSSGSAAPRSERAVAPTGSYREELGLAIAKAFVALHGGHLGTFDSELGGTCFQMTLPWAEPAPSLTAAPNAGLDRTLLDGLLVELRSAAPRPAPHDEASRARVLVATADRALSRAVLACLAGDYDVSCVADGKEALERALRLAPSLVVVDLSLPNAAGVALVVEMQKRSELADTPVLLLSEPSDEALTSALLALGARDFVHKPCPDELLALRVGNLVDAARAREDAKRHEQLLRSVFMQAPVMIALLRGPEHVVELVNAPMCHQIYKRPESELLHRSLLAVLSDVCKHTVVPLLEGVYRTGVPHLAREVPVSVQLDRHAGEVRHFDFTYAPFRSSGGPIDGVFVVATDVTAQVLARQQLAEHRASAEAERRSHDELWAALEQALTPSPELQQSGDASDGPRSSRALPWSDDLREIAHVASGQLDGEHQALDVADVVLGAVEATARRGSSAPRIDLEVPRGVLFVDGDRPRLSHLVSNLLTHATTYGGHEATLAVRAERSAGEITLAVRDTARGLPADALARLFEPAEQARPDLERTPPGQRLALLVAKSIAERHGGKVTTRSDGTSASGELVVHLPVSRRRLEPLN